MEHDKHASYIKTVSALSKRANFYQRMLAFCKTGNMISIMFAVLGMFATTIALSLTALTMASCSLCIYVFARRRLTDIFTQWDKLNDDQLQYIADMIKKTD